MRHIIDLIYKSDAKYRFTYIQIASALCFTEEDIRISYCNFSEERKNEAKKKRNKRAYENRLKKEGKMTKAEEKALHLEILKEHPEIDDITAKEYLGIGRTTYYNLKREIKESAVE